MQNFATNKSQTSLFARNVRVIFWIVFKMCPNTNLTFALSTLSVRWHQFKCNGSLGILLLHHWKLRQLKKKFHCFTFSHFLIFSIFRFRFWNKNRIWLPSLAFTYQNRKHIIWCFSFNINAIHFNHLVTDMYQTRSIGRTSMHNTCDDDFSSFFISFNSGTLRKNRIFVKLIKQRCRKKLWLSMACYHLLHWISKTLRLNICSTKL